jgi:hypothetical protein
VEERRSSRRGRPLQIKIRKEEDSIIGTKVDSYTEKETHHLENKQSFSSSSSPLLSSSAQSLVLRVATSTHKE